jgi:hypothetical protein
MLLVPRTLNRSSCSSSIRSGLSRLTGTSPPPALFQGHDRRTRYGLCDLWAEFIDYEFMSQTRRVNVGDGRASIRREPASFFWTALGNISPRQKPRIRTVSMNSGLDWLMAPVLDLRPRLMRRANCPRNLILQTAGQLAHAGTIYREEPNSRGPLHQIVPLQRLIW